jgi:hypothetical protein
LMAASSSTSLSRLRLTAKIRKEKGRIRKRTRSQDTRRKIIAGALVLIEQDPTIKEWLQRTLNKVLTRNDERMLFGLPLLPTEPTAPQQAGTPDSFGKKPPSAKATREDELT